MSTANFELEATVRNDLGRGASRRLRRTKQVPAVIYGAGKPAVSLTLDHNKLIHATSHEAFYSHILTIKTGTDHEKVILKAMQRHPAKPIILHMDFLRIRADQKLHMQIPLHFIGADDAPGAKEGGIFSHVISSVEVSCLPAHLPEYIEIDISKMALNDTLHLTDLKLPKNVELVALAHGAEGHDLPVVSLHIPRIIEEEVVAAPEDEAAEGEEGAEGTTSATDQPEATTEKKGKE